nr:BamA/TamA family outer membrane protein [uncultured Shimia sp.]
MTSHSRVRSMVGVACLASASWCLPFGDMAHADQSLVARSTKPVKQAAENEDIGFRRGSFIAAPIPFSNPLIETGLALGLGYLFQADPDSGTSVLGVGGLKSSNGSEAFGLTANLSLDADRWNFGGTFADADLNYDLIFNSLRIPISQTGTLGRVYVTRQVAPNLSLGLMGRYLSTELNSGASSFGATPPNYSLLGGVETLSYGITAEYDTRDSDIYPRSGRRLYVTALGNEPSTDLIGTYDVYTAVANSYHAMGEDSVLAFQAVGCATSETAPFYDLCSIGGTDSMRGFNPTKFLDGRLASLQVEYRRQMSKRFGLVAFAGAGAVGASFGDLDDYGIAGGVGLRIGVSKTLPVNFAIDVSHNHLNETLLYLSVGERF